MDIRSLIEQAWQIALQHAVAEYIEVYGDAEDNVGYVRPRGGIRFSQDQQYALHKRANEALAKQLEIQAVRDWCRPYSISSSVRGRDA